MAALSIRRPPVQQEAIQVAGETVVTPKPAPPQAKPVPVPIRAPRLARMARAASPTPAPLTSAPPPPTSEAKTQTSEPVVITGITMESTTQGGSFAVGVGNTL